MRVQVIGYARHEAYNEHAERLLGLVDEALRQAGVGKGEVQRIAVGVGPGSFTGVRVALAVGQGLMLGLNVPGLGVGSLRAIAFGLGEQDERVRVVVRDARRDEFFVAAYLANGDELLAPCAIPQLHAEAYVADLCASHAWEDFVVIGSPLAGLPYVETDETVQPDARAVGRLAVRLDPNRSPVEPCYVRGPNLVRPELVVSPLEQPRRTE